MTDARELSPGLAPGHPWIAFSRWQMAWLTALGVLLVGMLMNLIFGLITQGRIAVGAPFYLIAIVAIMCGVLAAIFGPWLRRFFPFSQALLFGLLTSAATLLLASVVSIGERLARGPCEPNVHCTGPFEGIAYFGIIFGLPIFFVAVVGFALAQWSPTRRGKKVFWPLLAGTLLIYMTVFALAALGVFDTPTEPQSSMRCGTADEYGREIEIPCGGF